MNIKSVCWAITLAVGLAIPVRAELIGYWKLDEGEGTESWDQTDYWHDVKIEPWNEAKVRWTTNGYDANALEFVSATSPFTLCDAPLTANLLNISEATYAFWMNMPSTFQAWGPILVLLGQNSDHSVECNGAADLLIADFGVDAYGDLGTSGAKLNDGQWRHIAVTYSASANAMTVYVDGQPAGNIPFGASDPITAVRIGGPRNRTQWRRYIGRLDEVAVWNHALSAADVKNVFWFGPQWTRFATSPEPANGAAIGTMNVTLRWTAGDTAARHHVFLGENPDDVKDGTSDTDKGTMAGTSFSDYTWELGKTYYWRVDEIEADGVTVYPGVVWSFTVSAKFASQPVPADGAVLVDPDAILSWTPGSGAVTHSVYLGTDPANLPRVSQEQPGTTYDPPQLGFGTTYFWRVDEFDGANTYTGEVWRFKTTPDFQVADPNLAGFWNFDQDENGIAIDWSGHGRHGTILGDPNRVEGYSLAALAFDGIDDRVEVPQVVSTDLTLMAWIKTDVPGAAGATARDGSGLLWSDHAGGGDHFTLAVLGTKLAFETGPGGNPNTISGDDVVTGEWAHVAVTRTESSSAVELFINGASSATGNHAGDNNVGSNPLIVIGANTLDSRYFQGFIDEVRAYNRVLSQEEMGVAMRGNPLSAWNPSPPTGGVVDIRYEGPLAWSPGDQAAEHDVYVGTDQAAVRAATTETADIYRGRQGQTAYDLAEPLQWGQMYYWRVDELNTDGTVTKGNVWSLRVADYLIVDGFEGYNDEENQGTRIYETWIDGWATKDNGSTVGNWDAPFAERTIVHSGRQSMPLDYNNVNAPFYSQAYRELAPEQDWTSHGVGELVVWFRGNPVAYMETAGGAFTISASGVDIWGTADEFRYAFQRLSGNGSLTVHVESIVNTNVWAKAGVMIRESLDPSAKFAYMVATPGSGVSFGWRQFANDTCGSVTQADIVTPQWVRLTRTNDAFTAQYSADGRTWTDMKDTDGTTASTTITMTGSIYLGLCVTSHNAAATTTAQFSGAATTGNVTGPWQVADVGIDHPGNSPQGLYVVLEDGTGRAATVANPDRAAALTTEWTEWKIPLSGFTGVDLTSVKRLYIGVGDKADPQPDGTGRVFIDDIRLTRPE